MIDENNNDQVPNFFEYLSLEDQKKFEEIKNTLGAPDHRYNRNKRLVTFQEMLESIKDFCERNDSEDWKRYIVCGICWFGNEIAINTRQLRILLGKSKSSINGAFAKMGYETLPSKGIDQSQLMDKIPFLKSNFAEYRQWTVRRSILKTDKQNEFKKEPIILSMNNSNPIPPLKKQEFWDENYLINDNSFPNDYQFEDEFKNPFPEYEFENDIDLFNDNGTF